MVCKEGRRARAIALKAVGEDALVLVVHWGGELAGQ